MQLCAAAVPVQMAQREHCEGGKVLISFAAGVSYSYTEAFGQWLPDTCMPCDATQQTTQKSLLAQHGTAYLVMLTALLAQP